MSYTFCQRCNEANDENWNVKQAEFHVGRIERWKVQLCQRCTEAVEQQILSALKQTKLR